MKQAIAFSLLVLIAAVARGQEVNLLTMGDWGHPRGDQPGVARAMADHVRSQSGRKFNAVLTAGDNFYLPLKDIHDQRWQTMFEKMYDPKVLNFPFYITLGNHDYELDRFMVEFAYTQANPESRWKMLGRFYRIELPSAEDPLVSVIVLDSSQPMVGEYTWKKQLEFLASELAKPRKSKWMICIAHHPLYSNGMHGDNGVLQRLWGPLFQQHGVDMYISGHDHDLQHLEFPEIGITFLMVGGGGATTRPMRSDQRGPFSRAIYGFADLQFTEAQVATRFVGVDGAPLHAFTRSKEGIVKIIETTGTDPAVRRTVRDVTRPDVATRPANR